MAYNRLEEGIVEWATWWHEHRDTQRSIEQELAFTKKALDGVLDLLAVAAVEMKFVKELGKQFIDKELERANSAGLIITPTGFRVPHE